MGTASLAKRIRRVPLPFWILVVLYVGVAGWMALTPDHPLFPDEAIAKVMVDSVATTGVPFAQEPITDYANGAFAPDPYSGAYADHRIASPPTNIATSYEQGALGPRVGRAVTLAIGLVALAYLARRLAGDWAAVFAGTLYLTNAAVLFYHQSYFANSGGAAWFLASIALLDASRERTWLVRLSAVAGAIAVAFRVEYALGLFALALVAWAVMREPVRILGYYATIALFLLVLWQIDKLLPISEGALFTQTLPLADLLHAPIQTLLTLEQGYGSHGAPTTEWSTFVQNAYDHFPFFFPLIGTLSLVGLFARLKDRSAAWVFVPLAAQTLLQGWAALAGMRDYYWSGQSWVESAIVRYFLVSYAFLALLAGIGLASLLALVPRRTGRVRAAPIVAVALVALLASASLATAWSTNRGLAWSVERKGWFDAIETAADSFGPEAVFVGLTPSKVIFARPVLDPSVDREGAPYVALDLLAKGHRVLALEPWFWTDGDPEGAMLASAHAYWTDTGVQVDCSCGEFARFYELHATNATLTNVARVEVGSFAEDARGWRTNAPVAFFFPPRALHVALGEAATRGVTVTLTLRDDAAGDVDAGYWNLPLADPKDRHPLAAWTSDGAGGARTVSLDVPATDIVNGAFYLRGPPGLLVTRVEVTPR